MKAKVWSKEEISSFCLELSLLLKAGLPAEICFSILAEEEKDERKKETLNELYEKSGYGDSVYEAMAASPKNVDPRNYVASVMDAIVYGKICDEHVAKLMECFKDGVMDACAPLLVQFGSYRKYRLVEQVTCEQMAERYRKAGI